MAAHIERFLHKTDYGSGIFIGDDPAILELTASERARVSAHRQACPRPSATIAEYGLEWTRQRYDECNFVFGQWICGFAYQHNPALWEKLISSTRRLPQEPAGDFERNTVPMTHFSLLSPLSTLVGYSLSRTFIDQAGRGEARTPERYFRAIDILEQTVQASQTPAELLAKLAEEVTSQDADPSAVLSHVLFPGILDEENNHAEYAQVADALAKYAPKLWQKYLDLTPEQKISAGIIDLPTRLKVFVWKGLPESVKYVSTEKIREGVECDTYTFTLDPTKDLGVIKVEAGRKSPLQEVVQGDHTIEGYMYGHGQLEITRSTGLVEKYAVGKNPYEKFAITVLVGDKMQWRASEDSKLVAYEVCYPPYKDGRYLNLD